MSVPQICHGWREGDEWVLSLKPREDGAARNKYVSKEAAIEAAKRRDKGGRVIGSLTIIWAPE
jgi:hypothetical protein